MMHACVQVSEVLELPNAGRSDRAGQGDHEVAGGVDQLVRIAILYDCHNRSNNPKMLLQH